MSDLDTSNLMSAESAVGELKRLTTPAGLRYGTLMPLTASHTSTAELARLTGTVPVSIALALSRSVYAFVPLALSSARLKGDTPADAFRPDDTTLIATAGSASLKDQALCHRTVTVNDGEYVFLSTLLHTDRFALAFELFINVAHDLVDATDVPPSFGELVEGQARAGVRGETSLDAWEHRQGAFGAIATEGSRTTRLAEHSDPALKAHAREEYRSAAFADAIAMYLLSLYLDFDYSDLREREYPLLSPVALAARLRAVHALFPPNDGYTFSILYRRRG